MAHLRIISDVHGKFDKYVKLAKEVPYSIQIGDMGFKYDALNELDPEKHRVLAGNHDNYACVDGKFVFQTPHFLGDFGTYNVPGIGDFFYVRGAYSIDKKYRRVGINWFEREELNYQECLAALEVYKSTKPDIVISHECPSSVIDFVGLKYWDHELLKPSNTANLLQTMLDFHRPKLWIFGHHHKNFTKIIDVTTFECREELGYIDFDKVDG
jgi:hypothetical protein